MLLRAAARYRGHFIIEALLDIYLGNRRASLILIVQIASPCVSHNVSHACRLCVDCVSIASRIRIITETQPTHNKCDVKGATWEHGKQLAFFCLLYLLQYRLLL
jgi:hypothetical protein